MESYDPERLELLEVDTGYIRRCVAFPKSKVAIDV
jgi:hypothetical protein